MAKTNKTLNPKYNKPSPRKVHLKLPISYSKKRKGELIPIPKNLFIRLVEQIDPIYFNKLKAIEWRQSSGNSPLLGSYLPIERKIVLYYVDYPIIVGSKSSIEMVDSLKLFSAKFTPNYADKIYNSQIVTFPARANLALWYLYFVFSHELAHHYSTTLNKYRRKRLDKVTDEKRTNLFAKRIFAEFVNDIKNS